LWLTFLEPIVDSSPHTILKGRNPMSAFKNIEVESDSMPVVELDTEAQAAYVRFREAKVVRTQEVETTSAVVTLDLDQADQIIGVTYRGQGFHGLFTAQSSAP
jgi:uncharacterized protein YuzE